PLFRLAWWHAAVVLLGQARRALAGFETRLVVLDHRAALRVAEVTADLQVHRDAGAVIAGGCHAARFVVAAPFGLAAFVAPLFQVRGLAATGVGGLFRQGGQAGGQRQG